MVSTKKVCFWKETSLILKKFQRFDFATPIMSTFRFSMILAVFWIYFGVRISGFSNNFSTLILVSFWSKWLQYKSFGRTNRLSFFFKCQSIGSTSAKLWCFLRTYVNRFDSSTQLYDLMAVVILAFLVVFLCKFVEQQLLMIALKLKTPSSNLKKNSKSAD